MVDYVSAKSGRYSDKGRLRPGLSIRHKEKLGGKRNDF